MPTATSKGSRLQIEVLFPAAKLCVQYHLSDIATVLMGILSISLSIYENLIRVVR